MFKNSPFPEYAVYAKEFFYVLGLAVYILWMTLISSMRNLKDVPFVGLPINKLLTIGIFYFLGTAMTHIPALIIFIGALFAAFFPVVSGVMAVSIFIGMILAFVH